MEEQLSSADLWLDPEKAEKLTRAYQQKQQEITELYEEWERLEEAVQA
jgi:prefoldin subunit 5